MDRAGRLAKAIRGRKGVSAYVYGIYVGAEDVDPDLSKVIVPGAALDGSDEVMRFVPRAAHVTGLAQSSTVLCVGSPLCIIAIVVGDVSLAEL